jgi:simple sugar transport system permease protein
MKANQVITGTSLNMLIPAVILLFSKMFFNSDGITTNMNFYIREIPVLGRLPVIGPMFFQRTYLTVMIGFVFLVISIILLYKTRLA